MAGIVGQAVSETLDGLAKAFMFTLKMVFVFLRHAIPWVLRVAWFTLMFLMTSVVSIFIGLPEATDRIATTWFDEAMKTDFPMTRFGEELYILFRVVAYIVLILGWIILAAVTVFVLSIIFAPIC